jgi:transcriptional regulator with XRE-family HTH domain
VPTKASHPLLKRVGVRLRVARRTKGLSQEALAHAANMDRSYVSGLERGEFNVSLLALARLSRVLNISLSVLVDGESR